MPRDAFRRALRGGIGFVQEGRWFPLADSLHHRLISGVPPGPNAELAPLFVHLKAALPAHRPGGRHNACFSQHTGGHGFHIFIR